MKARWNDNYIDTWGNSSATACHGGENVLEKRYRDGQLWQREQFLLCQEGWHESAQDVYQGWNHIEAGGDGQKQIWTTSALTKKVTPKWYKSDESAWEIRLASEWGRRNALRGSKLRRSGSWQEQQNILKQWQFWVFRPSKTTNITMIIIIIVMWLERKIFLNNNKLLGHLKPPLSSPSSSSLLSSRIHQHVRAENNL